jgi:hypothetical protein
MAGNAELSTNVLTPNLVREIPSDLLQRDPRSYAAEFPFLLPTLQQVDRLNRIPRPHARREVMGNFLKIVIKDPFLVSRLYDNLRIIGLLRQDPKVEAMIPEMFDRLGVMRPSREMLVSWSSPKIKYLFDASYDHFPTVASVMRGLRQPLFEAPVTPIETLGLFYKSAFAMVDSRVTLARVDLFDRIDAGRRSVSDALRAHIHDRARQPLIDKQNAQIDDAMEVMTKLLILKGMLRGRNRFSVSPDFSVDDWIADLRLNTEDPIGRSLSNKVIPEIREALAAGIVMEREKPALNTVPLELADGISLSVFSRSPRTVEEIKALMPAIYGLIAKRTASVVFSDLTPAVHELLYSGPKTGVYQLENNGDIDLTIQPTIDSYGRLSSILEYHRPNLTPEEMDKAKERVDEIRKYIKSPQHKLRGISSHGYQAIIADPQLRNRGFRYLTFHKEKHMSENQNKPGIKAKVTLFGQEFTLCLDDNLQIIPSDDIKKWVSEDDMVWTELIVLSHLKWVQCKSLRDLEQELPPELRKHHKEKFRTIRNRTEHLKRMRPYFRRNSPRANELFMKSELAQESEFVGLTLDDLNRIRNCTFENGLWTYVSPIEEDTMVSSKPIPLAIKNAMEDVADIVDMGKISEEEIARIESDIISDLI